MSNALPLQVDIVSDVVCPWCIIGYKQFLKGLAQMPGRFDVEIRWRPFELNPGMPSEGQELREHLAQKYGPAAVSGGSGRARLIDLGDKLGFRFDYFDGMRMYNTFLAHQLLHWAGLEGRQTQLKLALFEAFFSRRENVGDASQLVAVAERVGLAGAEARAVLSDGRYAELVREEQSDWLEREVHAVPTFFFNGKYQVPGAQEAETFVRYLDRIHEREKATG